MINSHANSNSAPAECIVVEVSRDMVDAMIAAGKDSFQPLIDNLRRQGFNGEIDLYVGRDGITTWVYRLAYHLTPEDIASHRWPAPALTPSMDEFASHIPPPLQPLTPSHLLLTIEPV